MKKIICLIVTVLLLINIMPFAALAANGDARDNTQDDTINFKISEATVHPGYTDKIVVYVDIANNPGFAGTQLTIQYDSDNLTLLSVARCDEFSQQFNLTVNKASGFVMLDNVSNVYGNGSLLQLTFSLKNSENNDIQTVENKIKIDVQLLFNDEFEKLKSKVDNGKIVVSHDWTDATCTATKTCKTCGATDGTVLDHEKGEVVKENNIPATANTPGSYDNVVYCKVCHAELSRQQVTVDPLNKGVAKIGETFYDTLKEALNDAKTGEKVTLVADTTEDILMVPAGVKLDLEGNTVEVGVAVLGYGHIVDTDPVAGGIKIGADKIVHLQPDNPYMPLYDKATGSYKFFEYTIDATQNASNISAGKMQYAFSINFANEEAYALIVTGESKLTVSVTFTWDEHDMPLVYEFPAEKYSLYGKGKYFKVTVTGVETIVGSTLVATAKFASETNVSVEASKSKEIQITLSNVTE